MDLARFVLAAGFRPAVGKSIRTSSFLYLLAVVFAAPAEYCAAQSVPATEAMTISCHEATADAWEAIGRYKADPTPDNAAVLMGFLDEALADPEAHSAGFIKLILVAAGEERAEEFRGHFWLFLEGDPGEFDADYLASEAVRALIALNGEHLIYDLLEICASDRYRGQSALARELGAFSDPRIILCLHNLALSDDAYTRESALHSLSQQCSVATAPYAEASLQHGYSGARAAAIRWFATCGEIEHEELIRRKLSDHICVVRSHAVRGLMRLGSKAGCDVDFTSRPELWTHVPVGKYLLSVCEYDQVTGDGQEE